MPTTLHTRCCNLDPRAKAARRRAQPKSTHAAQMCRRRVPYHAVSGTAPVRRANHARRCLTLFPSQPTKGSAGMGGCSAVSHTLQCGCASLAPCVVLPRRIHSGRSQAVLCANRFLPLLVRTSVRYPILVLGGCGVHLDGRPRSSGRCMQEISKYPSV